MACDRLAASEYYQAEYASRISLVPFEKIDTDAAIPACRAALNAAPASERVAYQLARALHAGGEESQLDAALEIYKSLCQEQNKAAACRSAGAILQGDDPDQATELL